MLYIKTMNVNSIILDKITDVLDGFIGYDREDKIKYDIVCDFDPKVGIVKVISKEDNSEIMTITLILDEVLKIEEEKIERIKK